MAKLAVYSISGKEVGEVSLPKGLSDGKVRTKALYLVINSYLSSLHRGTAKTKKRHEVSGGGKKPWRQKGTGRARSGSIRSPLWRHGGVVFGPTVRDFSFDVPHSARKAALEEALKSKVADKDIVVLDKIIVDTPKTKTVSVIIDKLKLGGRVLMVAEEFDKNISLASRNIPDFLLKRRTDINALDIMGHGKMVITEDAFKNLIKGL